MHRLRVNQKRFLDAGGDEILETLLDVAAELKRTPSQVAIRWAVEQPGITSILVGARTLEQLHDNLGAADWHLSEQAMALLNEISQLPDRYPQAIERNVDQRRDGAIGKQKPIAIAPTTHEARIGDRG